MATIQQQAIHWRDRAITRSEAISDAWQVFLAYAGRAAEIILFVCMVVSLVQMVPTVRLWGWLTGGMLVIQMITLDVAGFGLNSMAHQVRHAGDEATARKAENTGNFLIAIMIISLLSVAISQMFGSTYPVVGQIMTYLDYVLILTRVVMTVLYGRVIHALRESQQHMLAVADETEARLREELAQTREGLHNEQSTAQTEQARLTTEITTLKHEQAEQVNELSQQLSDLTKRLEEAQKTLHSNSEDQETIVTSLQKQISDLTEQLQEKLQLATDLQTAKATVSRLQLAESETAILQVQVQALTADLQTANSQRADLSEKLERTKKKLTDLQKTGEQTGQQPRREAVGSNITSIEQARTKGKMNHAEVIAFMASHTDFKRAEVAAQLGISERKVYDAVAWQREQEQENAVALQ